MRKLHYAGNRYDGTVSGWPEDGRAIAFSNSAWNATACPANFGFGYGRSLATQYKGRPLTFGGSWAELQDIAHHVHMAENDYAPNFADVCQLCTGNGCPHCSGSGLGPIPLAVIRWQRAGRNEQEIAELEGSLRKAWWFYRERYGIAPDPMYAIVGVEVDLATPVLTPEGHVWTPDTTLIRTDSGYRRPVMGECAYSNMSAETVAWPMMVLQRLDFVGELRSRPGALFVGEQKSSISPKGYLKRPVIDGQVHGYMLGLASLCRPGGRYEGATVMGFVMDAIRSKQPADPSMLKNGKGFKKGAFTSWQYLKAVEEQAKAYAEDHAEEKEEYEYTHEIVSDPEVLARAEEYNNDQFCRSPLWRVDAGDLEMFRSEMFGKARRVHSLMEKSARVLDPMDSHGEFPRNTSKCLTIPCSFHSPCETLNQWAFKPYKVTPSESWTWGEAQQPPTPPVDSYDHSSDDDTPKMDW